MNATNFFSTVIAAFVLTLSIISCNDKTKETTGEKTKNSVEKETPEYFLLHPEIEKAYGYSQAVKIGTLLKYQA